MSDVMEKAVAALPSLLSDSLGMTSDKDWGHSRNFQTFVKHISSLKNKTEEDVLLERELILQKKKLSQPNQSPLKIRESLMRIVYCHMLGKDVSFACIHAVKLAQQGSILDKKVGYLVCNLLMNKDNELVMLLINTMQKDLSSSNVLSNLAGLTAVIHLCGTEMVPAMLPLVKEKLSHPKDAVRKKAVMAMHHFLKLAPEMIHHEMAHLQRTLADNDPSVVWATLHVFSELVPKEPSSYQYLVPSLISILGQIIGRRLSTDYDYHTVPAPWMTIVILRLLSKLGAHDESTSQQMYPSLKEVLQKTEPSHKMGLAVIFECLQTITKIYPYPHLIDHAASCVGRFLSAKNINLKYLGLKALVSLVTISPQCTVEHQEIVLDCLEHHDPTIQRMTLQLLYKMAGSSNVKVISEKMLEFMSMTTDKVIRSDIIHKVIELTERFSSDLLSYLRTMNRVIQIAERYIPADTIQTILWKISQDCISTGDESDPLANKQLRAAVFQLYFQLLQDSNLPETLIEISAWVLGEYNHCVQGIAPNQVITTLLQLYTVSNNNKTKCQITGALQKMAYYITDPSAVMTVLKTSDEGIGSSHYYELKQRNQELEELCKCKQDVKIAANPETRIPLDKMDLTLSFLDEFVCEALEGGAQPYKPQMLRGSSFSSVTTSITGCLGNLNFTPYELPHISSKSSLSSSCVELTQATPSVSSGSTNSREMETSLKLKSKKKVWSKEGVIKEESAEYHQDQSVTKHEDNNASKDQRIEQEFRVMSPEQIKRKQLADAIFHEIKPKIQHQNEGDPLLSLCPGSTASSADAGSVHGNEIRSPSLPEAPQDARGDMSLDNLRISDGCQSNTGSNSKNVFSQLLDYDSMTSPEDHILMGSLYNSNNLNSSITRQDYSKNATVNEQMSADLTNTSSNDVKMVKTPQNDPSCGSPDDSSLLAGKSSQPSPWKLLDHRKPGSDQGESEGDSVSLEEDSIEEDEPPREFIVDASGVTSDHVPVSGVAGCEVVTAHEEGQEQSATEYNFLAENSDFMCCWEKVLKPECLLFLLYFKVKNKVLDDGNAEERSGSLQIECSGCDIMTFGESGLGATLDATQLISAKFPSTVTLQIKPSTCKPLPHIKILLTLPGDEESIQSKFDFSLTDFLRPHHIDVEQFAEAWTADDNVLRRTAVSIQHHRDLHKIIENLGFESIQQKGSEVIYASRWPCAVPEVLLLHTKCGNSAAQVSVKGRQVQLVVEVTSCIQEILPLERDDVSKLPPVHDENRHGEGVDNQE